MTNHKAFSMRPADFFKQFVPVSLEMADFVEDGSGGTTKDMAARYLASHSASPVNGILIFSFGDGGRQCGWVWLCFTGAGRVSERFCFAFR